MKHKIHTSIFLLFTLLSGMNSIAQETEVKKDSIQISPDVKPEKERLSISPEIQGGITIGGEITDGRFVYKASKGMEITANFKFSNRVYYGIGAGVEFYKDELFIPVFVCFKGMLSKDDNTKYIFAQIGYAAAENKNIYSFTNYKYSGGIFFSPGIGYKISVKGKYFIMPNISYKHQFASVKYETTGYKEVLSFNLISFKVGVFF